MKPISFITAMAVSLVFSSFESSPGQEIVDPDVGDPYPLVICILSSEPLDEGFETIDHQGRDIRVCCTDCASRFSDEGDIYINGYPGKYLKIIWDAKN